MKEIVKLGSLITGVAARDAIHIAVAPIVAGENLQPGQHVGLSDTMYATSKEPHVGIVDPFLKEGPRAGSRFFLCLYPHTITSLRHEWTHPAFSGTDDETWLRKYAEDLSPYDPPGVAFDNLIYGLKSGELYAHGTDLHSLAELDNAHELRDRAERYLGIKINWDDFTFSCSC